MTRFPGAAAEAESGTAVATKINSVKVPKTKKKRQKTKALYLNRSLDLAFEQDLCMVSRVGAKYSSKASFISTEETLESTSGGVLRSDRAVVFFAKRLVVQPSWDNERFCFLSEASASPGTSRGG